tara:strand:- start:802 stop:1827 length:1026 start_codon:yes stop_codon:yes gene_type:complete
MKYNVAINGFGRIGRTITRINAKKNIFNLVLINELNSNINNLSYLLKYDSIYGESNLEVSSSRNFLKINGKNIICTSFQNLNEIKWNKKNIDIIIDCSGTKKDFSTVKKILLKNNIKYLIYTNSSNKVDKEIIMGTNERKLTKKDKIISSSICDANALANVIKLIDDEYNINNGSITTIHPWLSYQNLLDGPVISEKNRNQIWPDFALGRSSINNLIPKKTTAIAATEKVLPKLKGRLLSFSYRVPTSIVSSSDLTLNIKKNIKMSELKKYLIQSTKRNNYIKLNFESLVSIDYKQNEASVIIDMQWLQVNKNTIKLVIWYDNEWGYSCRVLDLIKKLSTL